MPVTRIKALQDLIKTTDFDGFILPSNDEFLSEYVADTNNYIKWLTGFTGSNGVILVFKTKMIFFTDSRYTLQAKQELGNELYAIYDLSEKSVKDFLHSHVKDDDKKIGYDPKLHTKKDIEKYGARYFTIANDIMERVGFVKEASHTVKHAFIHELAYSGQEVKDKVIGISKILEDKKLDAFFIHASDSVNWLLNLRGNDVNYTPILNSHAMVYANGRIILFTDLRKLPKNLLDYLHNNNVSVCEVEDFIDNIDYLTQDMKNIGIDYMRTSIYFIDIFSNVATVTIQDIKDICLLPKAIKNKAEIAGAKTAHIRDGIALAEFFYWLSQNIPTNEVLAADKLHYFRNQQKLFFSLSFATISAFGSNGAIVHYNPEHSDNIKTLEHDGLYLCDSGGQYHDGTTDVTRTIVIGKASKEQKHHFTLVLKGHIAVASAIFKQGTTGSQFDILARQYLWQAGLDYGHGTGHGVGSFLSVHEAPHGIHKFASEPLVAGMILSNEPGYYLEGKYGIRIESLLLVEKHEGDFLKFTTITQAPIDVKLIDLTMLTNTEADWLNNYHKQVYKSLASKLTKTAKIWLKQVTEPISLLETSTI